MSELKGLKILVVDDEELIREVIRFKLEDEGMVVDEAGDGDEAFEKIITGEFDFVLSDVRMPKCSGVQLLDKLREFEGKTPKVIMMSAFSDLNDKSAKDKGALGLLLKPKEMENIIDIIESYL